MSSTERMALKSGKFAIENAAPDNWYDVVTSVMPTNAIKNVVKKARTKALGNAGDVAKKADVPDAPSAGKTTADNQYFTSKTEYKAPDSGTGKTYTAHQQGIDPDMMTTVVNKKTGDFMTNRELMQDGKTPYIMKDGGLTQVQLHHSRQNADGSLFELSVKTHQTKTGQGAEALHPYKTKAGQANNGVGSGPTGKQHPSNPVDRPAFDTDRDAYWKDRISQLGNGGNN